MTDDSKEKITTAIWREEPEPDNRFAARRCFCAGFDVYGDLLGKATWVQYLYVLFKLEQPSPEQAVLLENLAVALANPGPRDHSVRAAMNAGVGGSTAASALTAAVAVGAGNLGGGREVFKALEMWQTGKLDLGVWLECIANPPEEPVDIWLPMEHVPGFDPHGVSCATPVRQTLDVLAGSGGFPRLKWLQRHRVTLEQAAAAPLAMSGVAAAALADLELSPEQGEMLYLMLRLPGAAVHALEQSQKGWTRYPFFGNALHLSNDPGPVEDACDEKRS